MQRPMLRLVSFCLAVVFAQSTGSVFAGLTLYDDSVSQKPAEQPWLNYADDSLITSGTATETVVPGVGVRLVTDNSVSAGYSNYQVDGTLKNAAFPSLDRATGYWLDFELKVNSESHSGSDNRAGFSVIALSSDRKGIELGFWEDRIWAQADDPLFTKSEESFFDTTADEVSYRLFIQDDTYDLYGEGSLLLSGQLRDYTAFGNAPYIIPNFIFFGDNTSSAQADVILGQIAVSSVPEPATFGMTVVFLLGILGRPLLRRTHQSSVPTAQAAKDHEERLA